MDHHDHAADELDNEQPSTGEQEPVLGAGDSTDGQQTALAKVEEERDLTAQGVGCTAVKRRVEAAGSCAETHGEPDFDAHVLLYKKGRTLIQRVESLCSKA